MRSSLLLSALFLLALAACSGTPPYVLDTGEFNRESETYATGPKDIAEVVVCYRDGEATDPALAEIARDRCAKYEKKAVFRKKSYSQCPMMTPFSAEFDCIGARPMVTRRGADARPSGQGQQQEPPVNGGMGWPFYYSPAPPSANAPGRGR